MNKFFRRSVLVLLGIAFPLGDEFFIVRLPGEFPGGV